MDEHKKDISGGQEIQWVDKHGDYLLTPVPKNVSKRAWALCFIFLGTIADVSEVMGGGVLGSGFGVRDVFLVCVIGSLILAGIGGMLAWIGSISRCSTYVNFRPAFGVFGSNIFSTVASAIPNIGWFGILAWQFGLFIHALMPNVALCNVLPATIWGGCLMVVTAYFGIKGLEFFSYLAVPYFILLSIFGVMIGVNTAGSVSALLEMQPVSPATWGQGITDVVGMMMAMCLCSADITRFSKSRWGGVGAWGAAMVLQVFILTGAAMLTLSTGSYDVPAALKAAGVGFGAFLMVILGQWSTNDNNLYYSTLAIGMYTGVTRRKLSLILGAVGVIFGALIATVFGTAADPMQAFLGTMGTVLPGLGGVMAADFFIYRAYKGEKMKDRYQFKPGMVLPKINWVGCVTCILAVILGGWVIPGGAPAINVLLCSIVFYSVGAILCDKLNISMGIGEHVLTETGE